MVARHKIIKIKSILIIVIKMKKGILMLVSVGVGAAGLQVQPSEVKSEAVAVQGNPSII